jgi:hypothetical protein
MAMAMGWRARVRCAAKAIDGVARDRPPCVRVSVAFDRCRPCGCVVLSPVGFGSQCVFVFARQCPGSQGCGAEEMYPSLVPFHSRFFFGVGV